MNWNVLRLFRRQNRSRRPVCHRLRLEQLEDRLAPAGLPTDFSETMLAAGLTNPTAMEFAPDGRLFVCEQAGKLRVIQNGVLLPTSFVNLPVNSQGERGLLGVTLDPDFATNQFVYVYYTAGTPAIHNRISRFTANGNVAVAGSEVVLMDLENLGPTNHNGGAIHFGPDGKLYIAVGENGVQSNAQTLANRLGKMLRINADGTIPIDNPYYNHATGLNRSIWAVGLRNPFTFSFQAGTGRMFINDVGQSTWEEINDGIAGSNYGWPFNEGATSTPGYRDPLFQYGHGSTSTTGIAITGGAFYDPSTVNFPSNYVGDYFFADFGSGWIRRYDPVSDSAVDFASGIFFPVDLKVTDDGSLYYLARGSGQVWKIRYTPDPVPAGATILTTTVTAPTVYTEAVTFTATVAAGSATPTGTVTFQEGSTVLDAETLDGNGQAFFTSLTLSAGSHAITATYSGDSNYDPSTSAALIRTVLKLGVATSVASSTTSSVFGQTVAFTATVSNASGTGATPTGMVTFKDGSASLGSAALDGSGQATFTTSALAARTHTITAVYAGDSNQKGATSAVVLQTVARATTSTTMPASNINPSWPNQPVTFTATVSNTGGTPATPTGIVTFKDGTATLGSAALNASGVATFTKSNLTAATHTIMAIYAGTANFSGSTSASVYLHTVSRADTSTSLTSSANPASTGQVVIFTATVNVASPWMGTPTGSVTFKEGTVTLGSGALNGSGVATFTKSNLTVGTHSITAAYAGNTSFSASSYTLEQSVTVGAITTTTIVGRDPNPAFPDQVVTITATVSSGSGTPGGLVTFKDGATVLGSAALDGSATATFTWTALKAAGIHTLRAIYAANTGFSASTSAAVTETVIKRTVSSLVVTSNPAPSASGSGVVFTATVAGNGGGTPAGTITFKEGATVLGSATLNASGAATLVKILTAAGTHSITAVYSGSMVYGSTSAAYTQTVNTPTTDTTTTVTPSTAPLASAPGQTVVFTASVAGSGGTPTGLVTFKDGTTTLGLATLGGGTATLAKALTAQAVHTIKVLYGGDGTFKSSTGAVTLSVTRATTTSLAFDNTATVAGQPISFTATVTGFTGELPTGTVTFRDGATAIGTAALSGGIATLVNSPALRAAGTHTLRAVYGGSTNFAVSTSAALLQVVSKADTTTALSSNINLSSFGQTVTFTAVVSVVGPGTLGAPAGTVTFKEGTTTLGTAAVNATTGVATLTKSSLSAGAMHTISAVYGGSTAYNASTTTFVQTIKKSTTTAITFSPVAVAVNALVIFTATVSGTSGPPTGMVTFREGSSDLGTAVLDGSGKATFTFLVATTGLHTLTAAYGGDTAFAVSSSSLLKLNML